MKRLQKIMGLGLILSLLLSTVTFGQTKKFLDISAMGDNLHIILDNYVGEAPEMKGRKVLSYSGKGKWSGTSKDLDKNYKQIIDETAVTKGKTRINRKSSKLISYGTYQFQIIGALKDGTLVIQTGDNAFSFADKEVLDDGEYILGQFIDDGKMIMAEKLGYLRVGSGSVVKSSGPVAAPTSSKVLVNNKPISFEAYTIDNNNYIKLRDFAYSVKGSGKQFEVSWDPDKGAINLVSNVPYSANGSELKAGNGQAKSPVLNKAKIYKDGENVDLKAYTIDGNNYFKLRDLAGAFGIAVRWDEKTSTIGIDTSI